MSHIQYKLLQTIVNYFIINPFFLAHTLLTPGIASSWDIVPKGYYRYFTVLNPNITQDLSFILQPAYGDPDLFVSQITDTPSSKNYTWASRRGRNIVDAITIETSDNKWDKNNNRFFLSVKFN